jgi:hypothetical protein
MPGQRTCLAADEHLRTKNIKNEKIKGEKMKRKFLLMAAMALCLAGCDEPDKISGVEFQARITTDKSDMVIHAEYVCEEGQNVYLRESSKSIMDDKIWVKRYYYTDKSELDADFYATLTPKVNCPAMFYKERVSRMKNEEKD